MFLHIVYLLLEKVSYSEHIFVFSSFSIFASFHSFRDNLFNHIQLWSEKHPVFSTLIHNFGKIQIFICNYYMEKIFYKIAILYFVIFLPLFFIDPKRFFFEGLPQFSIYFLWITIFLMFSPMIIKNRGVILTEWFPDMYETILQTKNSKWSGLLLGKIFETVNLLMNAPRMHQHMHTHNHHFHYIGGPKGIKTLNIFVSLGVSSIAGLYTLDMNLIMHINELISSLEYSIMDGTLQKASVDILREAKQYIIMEKIKLLKENAFFRVYDRFFAPKSIFFSLQDCYSEAITRVNILQNPKPENDPRLLNVLLD